MQRTTTLAVADSLNADNHTNHDTYDPFTTQSTQGLHRKALVLFMPYSITFSGSFKVKKHVEIWSQLSDKPSDSSYDMIHNRRFPSNIATL